MWGLSFGQNFPTVERDPEIRKIERETFSRLSEIATEASIASGVPQTNNTFFVSFEDALKELVSIKNSQKTQNR